MKLLILAAIVAVTLAVPTDKEFREQWSNFKKQFNKEYETDVENVKRLRIFSQNLAKIERHNKRYDAGEVTYKLGITPFADWTSKEFMAYVNSSNFHNAKIFNNIETTEYKVPKEYRGPASIDWRDNSAVTEVKNQGSCGSCWAFGAVVTLEGQHAAKHGQLISLSEQNLIDCAGYLGTSGCNGGSLFPAYNYVFQHGINTEEKYPYEAVDASCRFDETASVLQIKGITAVAAGSEATLEAAIGAEGPLAGGIQVTDNFQHYSNGVFYDESCQPNSRNHAVGIVGYSNDNGVDYWLVKNSWGDGWGEGGYIKMARKRDNNCDIAGDASYPTF